MFLTIDLQKLILNFLPLNLVNKFTIDNKYWYYRYQFLYNQKLNNLPTKFLYVNILTYNISIKFLYAITSAYNYDEICDMSEPFLPINRVACILAKNKNYDRFGDIVTTMDSYLLSFLINNDQVDLVQHYLLKYKNQYLDNIYQQLNFQSVKMINLFVNRIYIDHMDPLNYWLYIKIDLFNVDSLNNYQALALIKRKKLGQKITLPKQLQAIVDDDDSVEVTDLTKIVYFMATKLLIKYSNSLIVITSNIIDNVKFCQIAIDVFGLERARDFWSVYRLTQLINYSYKIALKLVLFDIDIKYINNLLNSISFGQTVDLIQALALLNKVDILSQLRPTNQVVYTNINKFILTNKDVALAIVTNKNLKSYYNYFDFTYIIDLNMLSLLY